MGKSKREIQQAHPEMGDLMDQQMDADREWFKTHPFARQRFRPPFEVERSEFALFGIHNIRKIKVVQIAPGLRARLPIQ